MYFWKRKSLRPFWVLDFGNFDSAKTLFRPFLSYFDKSWESKKLKVKKKKIFVGGINFLIINWFPLTKYTFKFVKKIRGNLSTKKNANFNVFFRPRNITKIIKNWLQNFMLMENLPEINYIAFWQPFIIGFNEKKLRNIPSSSFGLHHFF